MCLLTVEPYNQAHALTALCRIDSGGVTVAIRRSGKRVLGFLTRDGAVERSGVL